MEVYALIGKSGTGKSHRAQYISKDHGIECIIDDGLLINGNRIAAGVSAKKEETKIGAIRRAIFTDVSHREEVIETIKALDPQSLLILGTSDAMVNKIVEHLKLPPVSKVIYIEDIATQREIETATKTRKEQGKHVIPIPTFAIKKDFSGYFIDSIKSLSKRGRDLDNDYIEKTVVRPTFSYLGKYTIADNVIKSMVSYAGEKVEGVHKILKVAIENRSGSLKIDIDMCIDFGFTIPDTVNRLREYVKDEIEHMTAFNILEINIYVKSINTDRIK